MTPLKTHWLALYKPITENMALDMRMNLQTRKVCYAACVNARVALTKASVEAEIFH